MGLKQIDHGTPEYRQMVKLRDEMLRKPLGLSFSQEELSSEVNEILIASFDEEEMLGCCMLKPLDNCTLRLRQMAVRDEHRLTGIGASIVHFAENLAKDKGYNKIIMHARDTAVGFYEKLGYKINGEAFKEVGIPHHMMEKSIL